MRIIYSLIIVMIPTLIVAQGFNGNIRDAWNCASIDLNGYSWNGSTWERQNFATRSWEFTFAGNVSRQTINGQRVDFSCNNDLIIKQCSYHGLYFMFNTETGRGALADLFGVAINPDDNRQVFIELVECTRNAFGIDSDIAAPLAPTGTAIAAPLAPADFKTERGETILQVAMTALETRLRELEELKNDGDISEQEYLKARSAALGL